jgi:heme O synthase-like polyprenyltransferase
MMHPAMVRTRNRNTASVAVRRDQDAGIASYLTVAGIAASLIVVWAGICLI